MLTTLLRHGDAMGVIETNRPTHENDARTVSPPIGAGQGGFSLENK